MKSLTVDQTPPVVPVEPMDAVLYNDDDFTGPVHDDIATLAYSYWEARGRQGGSPWDDWFRAEQELMRRREL